MHLVAGGAVACLLLWLMNIHLVDGLVLHFLGVTTLTLVVGWSFTVLAANAGAAGFFCPAGARVVGLSVSRLPVGDPPASPDAAAGALAVPADAAASLRVHPRGGLCRRRARGAGPGDHGRGHVLAERSDRLCAGGAGVVAADLPGHVLRGLHQRYVRLGAGDLSIPTR
jgi:hypothetical protein